MIPKWSAWRWFIVSFTAVYWLIVFGLTHLPPSDLPETHVSDKVAHFSVYAVLGTLVTWCLLLGRRHPLRASAIAVLLLLAYGAFDELTQPIVGRTCSIYDWYADATGAVAGSLAVFLVNLGLKSPSSPPDSA